MLYTTHYTLQYFIIASRNTKIAIFAHLCSLHFSVHAMSFSNTSTPEGNVPLLEIDPSIEPGVDFNERYEIENPTSPCFLLEIWANLGFKIFFPFYLLFFSMKSYFCKL